MCGHYDPGVGTLIRYDPHVAWYERFRPSLNDDEADALRRILGSARPRCLDIGCGTGVAIPELTRLGWTVVGVDVSDEMLNRARPHGIELHRASGEDLPFDDASFDAAVSIWTHTDVEDFTGVLRETARVPRPAAPFVYIGAHPCFVGPHSRFIAAEGIPALHGGYRRTERYEGGPAIGPDGLRAKVGVTHLPLGLSSRRSSRQDSRLTVSRSSAGASTRLRSPWAAAGPHDADERSR
jgi:SAM-dependent methyltransferase